MIYIAVFLIPAIPDDTACLEVMSITNFSRHLNIYNMSKVFRQRLKNNWFEKNRFLVVNTKLHFVAAFDTSTRNDKTHHKLSESNATLPIKVLYLIT